MKKKINVIIGVATVIIVMGWLTIGIFTFKSINYVNEHGLKQAIEVIWEGKK